MFQVESISKIEETPDDDIVQGRANDPNRNCDEGGFTELFQIPPRTRLKYDRR